MRASKAIFIAVGTPPTEQGEADLSYVESVARSVSGAINGYKVVVEKSTVPVYTSDWVRKIILRNAAAPDSFDVASNPEFLREGTAVTDFLYPDRIVVGRGQRTLRRRVARDLRAHDRWQLLPAQGCDSGARPGPGSSSAHCYQRQERRTDQARLQRFSRDEDFFYQCGGINLRIGGCERAAGLPGDRDRQPHRSALPESRDRLRRIVLSQGPDGFPRRGAGVRIRVPAAGRGHAHQ